MIDIVAWSGGMDSTLILDKLCSSGKSVWAFSVVWNLLNELKIKQEKIARRNYLEYAKNRGCEIYHRTITVTADMGAINLGLPQALAWCSFLFPYLPKESTLYFGYHKEDDFWFYDQSVARIINEVVCIGERKINLEYLLKHKKKYIIMQEFNARRIPLGCVWTCENPIFKNGKIVKCGKCEPCITLKLAKYESQLKLGK